MFNWSGISKSELLQGNNENHGNSFLILYNDILFGKQAWAHLEIVSLKKEKKISIFVLSIFANLYSIEAVIIS